MRPLLIVAVLIGCAVLVMVFAPQPKRQANDRVARMTVDTQRIAPTAYAVEIQSYGTVQPRTQSLLAAQVGGQVTRVSANFREGGFFRKGDVLLEIDPRDYQANVKVAEAGVMDARQRLQEENARAEQAAKDWERLGKGDVPGDLVLRKPQVLAAEARLVSASASLDKARLELERTSVVAPFDGRVLRKLVGLGQVVSRNAQVGEVFATDVVEIRLPVRNHDLAFVDLPEHYIDTAPQEAGPRVDIVSTLAGQHWQGEIVRTESAIDEVARQLHVVAQLDNPFRRSNTEAAPIKIGQYVTARIAGKTLSDAIVIPVRSIYQGSYVYIVQDGVLYRRDIEIAWQNGEQAVIDQGLVDGDQLITTPMGQVISGTPVRVRGTPETERGVHARVEDAPVPAVGVSG
jgi:RND family efflux transporter MFP subunit